MATFYLKRKGQVITKVEKKIRFFLFKIRKEKCAEIPNLSVGNANFIQKINVVYSDTDIGLGPDEL